MVEVDEKQIKEDIEYMVNTLIEIEKLQQKLAIKLTEIIGGVKWLIQ